MPSAPFVLVGGSFVRIVKRSRIALLFVLLLSGCSVLAEIAGPEVLRLEAGRPYADLLSLKGAKKPLTWKVIAGVLPRGIESNPDGAIWGSTSETGTYTLQLEVLDGAAQTHRVEVQLEVSAPQKIKGKAVLRCGTLDKEGATYYLAQDLTASQSCLFIAASRITLDLNGHSITYGTHPPEGCHHRYGDAKQYAKCRSYAIYSLPEHPLFHVHSDGNTMNGEVLQDHLTVRNGWIIQAAGAGEYSDAILFENWRSADHQLFSNLDITIAAPSSMGIHVIQGKGGNRVEHNVFHNRTRASWNRHQIESLAIKFENAYDAPAPNVIAGNVILGGAQGGIFSDARGSIVELNFIHLEGGETNDFCVYAYAARNEIRENICRGHSRGFHISSFGNQGSDGKVVHDNTVSVQELRHSREYSQEIQISRFVRKAGVTTAYLKEAHPMQPGELVTVSADAPLDAAFHFRQSVIYVESVPSPITFTYQQRGLPDTDLTPPVAMYVVRRSNGCQLSGAYGIQVEGPNEGAAIRNNYVEAIADECPAAALRITSEKNFDRRPTVLVEGNTFVGRRAKSSVMGAVALSENDVGPSYASGILLRDNEFSGDSAMIHLDYDTPASPLDIQGNVWKRGRNSTSDWVFATFGGYGPSTYATGPEGPASITLTDPIVTDGADIRRVRLGQEPVPLGQQFQVFRTYAATFLSDSAVLAGADVQIVNQENEEVFSGRTGADGRIKVRLLEFSATRKDSLNVIEEPGSYTLMFHHSGCESMKLQITLQTSKLDESHTISCSTQVPH